MIEHLDNIHVHVDFSTFKLLNYKTLEQHSSSYLLNHKISQSAAVSYIHTVLQPYAESQKYFKYNS